MYARLLVSTLLLAGALAGCNSNSKLITDLKVFGLEYNSYQIRHQLGPADWDAFLKDTGDQAVVQRVRDAGYQVKWGVGMREIPDTSTTVLAERPRGGPKLMFD